MRIPVMNGVFTSKDSDFRVSYPRNLIPVAQEQGISNGYLRPAEGITQFAIGLGFDRGGINWNGICYRVSGQRLISIDKNGIVTDIGNVGGQGQTTLDYSFDYLGIASSEKFFLWDGAGNLTKVTDSNLGPVVDFIWVDGYFMTTDGEFLIVSELNDPFSINPLKYGSSEIDPDPVIALLKINNQPHALNRYTIESYSNIGGSGFPFQRIEGSQMRRGVIGTHACCVFLDAIVFLGSGRNESPSVWIGSNGRTIKLATREIDQILNEYTEEQLSEVVIEPRVDKGHQQFYLHLPDQTLVYDAAASQITETPIWHRLTSGIQELGQYLAKNIIWCYDKWIVGDPTSSNIGELDYEVSSHWGNITSWEFGTLIIYNEVNSAIFHELELVGLTGRATLGNDVTISAEYSTDGETWSIPKFIKVGKQGERNKRLVWLQQGLMRQMRLYKFKGTNKARLSIAALEARIEGLAW